MSQAPTVTMIRSYGAAGGQPFPPSAWTTLTRPNPDPSRCSRAAATTSASRSTVVTVPAGPASQASRAAL